MYDLNSSCEYTLARLAGVFGESLYVELVDRWGPDDEARCDRLAHLAADQGVGTVVTNDVASEVLPDAGEGVPLVQVTLTGTAAALFGMKSLTTVNVPLFCVLVIVQEEPAPFVMPTLAHGVWTAV